MSTVAVPVQNRNGNAHVRQQLENMVGTAEVRRHKNSFTRKDWLVLYASGANRNDSYCWLEIWHRASIKLVGVGISIFAPQLNS